MTSSHVVVVGASLSGLRAAEQLRAAGHDGPITLVGEETHLPYNRPPLSKEVLADAGDSDPVRLHALVAFRRRASLDDVEFRLGRRVVRAELAQRRLHLDTGDTIEYDGLVVATGLRPRRLDLPGPAAGRYVLRTLDDAVALRHELASGRRVLVIGGGFIGTETACTLTQHGCEVTVVEPFGAPMERILGSDLARAVQRHLTAGGVTFETDVAVTGFTGPEDGRVDGVVLGDNRVLPADLVVESVGSLCNTAWLEGNPGLDLVDGVLCDNDLEVVGAPGVVVVGDVARFPNPLFDDVPRRVEHWSMATDTAKRAAPTLVARLRGESSPATPFVPIPSFWSDQLDLRFQSFGSPGLADEARLVEGDLDELAAGVLVTYHRGGTQVGTVAVNLAPARQRELRNAYTALVPAS